MSERPANAGLDGEGYYAGLDRSEEGEVIRERPPEQARRGVCVSAAAKAGLALGLLIGAAAGLTLLGLDWFYAGFCFGLLSGVILMLVTELKP